MLEKYLHATGLWDEVKDRLHTPVLALLDWNNSVCVWQEVWWSEPQFILADEVNVRP
ncbi:MAG: hypothetical protein V8R52_10110 [Coprobacter fastidiosus]